MIPTSPNPTAQTRAPSALARYATPAGLAAAAIAIELFGDAGRALLRYQRDAVLDGELWRLVSGNLAHLGPRHLVLNLVALGALWALAADALRGRRGLLAVAGGALGVGCGLLAFAPAIGWYVGLSGVLHGLLAVATRELLRAGDGFGLPLAALLIGKLAWEAGAGPLPFTASAAGGPVVVVAHLHGAVGALLAVVAAERVGARL